MIRDDMARRAATLFAGGAYNVNTFASVRPIPKDAVFVVEYGTFEPGAISTSGTPGDIRARLSVVVRRERAIDAHAIAHRLYKLMPGMQVRVTIPQPPPDDPIHRSYTYIRALNAPLNFGRDDQSLTEYKFDIECQRLEQE